MGILTLPPELLEIILNLSRPYNFENLALTCKQIYHAALHMIAHHNNLRKKYRRFKFGSETAESIPELLGEIAADPIIASYIVHPNFGEPRCPDTQRLSHTFPKGISDTLAPLVKQSRHLAALNNDPDSTATWLKNIAQHTDEDERPFDGPITFLLSLLPNVESLILPEIRHECLDTGGEEGEFNRSVHDLLHLLVTRANDAKLDDQPLQKLHTILPTPNILEQSGVNMEIILPFLALNSLREVYHECGVYEPSHDDCTHYPTLGKQVEVMKLKDYVITSGGAAVLFKNMQRLRVLELEYSMKDEIGYGWEINNFIWCMRKHIAGNLERLVLSAGQVWPDSALMECSMRAFKVLTHLELDTVFFVNSTGSMGNLIDVEEESEDESEEESEGESEEEKDDGFDEEVADDDGYDESDDNEKRDNEQEDSNSQQGNEGEDQDETAQADDDENEHLAQESDQEDYDSCDDHDRDGKWRLVSLLPPSLQTLIIHAPASRRDVKCLKRLFDGFEDRREANLPLLTKVKVVMRIRDCFGTHLDDYQQHLDQARADFGDRSFIEFTSWQ
ncbi:F-box domain-containing protein [Pochonia chlamydosporia 170]|uniref:F-box domain-containing protein n=1 Tax=Pochonia chlamydosporia 170 TaxID=1380566 RepID=A0A179FCL9_METCM|nr:F-box domain-containing protein [Pochonia chlamydosporia 170]OAQ62803.1 F-box domain-containing protein [Pochonia chlamydosporia 170]